MFPIFHLLVPVAILRLLKVDKTMIFMLSPLAVISDLDHIGILFNNGWTRALFHNIFFGVLLVFLLFLLKKNCSVPAGKSLIARGFRHAMRYDDKKFILISSFMFLSHILLDYSGIAFLWPFSTAFFRFSLSTLSFSMLNAQEINAGLLALPLQTAVMQSAIFFLAAAALFAEVYLSHRIKGSARRESA